MMSCRNTVKNISVHNYSLQFDIVSVCLSCMIHSKSSHPKCTYRFILSPPMNELIIYSIYHYIHVTYHHFIVFFLQTIVFKLVLAHG